MSAPSASAVERAKEIIGAYLLPFPPAASQIEAMILDVARALDATPAPVLRCQITGNPVGTDTIMLGHPCTCGSCSATPAEVEAALREWLQRNYARYGEEASMEQAQYMDLLSTVTALVDSAVGRERTRILGLMAHASPCQQSDVLHACPHDEWGVCLDAAIRQTVPPVSERKG